MEWSSGGKAEPPWQLLKSMCVICGHLLTCLFHDVIRANRVFSSLSVESGIYTICSKWNNANGILMEANRIGKILITI